MYSNLRTTAPAHAHPVSVPHAPVAGARSFRDLREVADRPSPVTSRFRTAVPPRRLARVNRPESDGDSLVE